MSKNQIVQIIDCIRKEYRDCQKVIADSNIGKIVSENDLRTRTYITKRIQNVVNFMEDKERLIIFNEIIMGKKGRWYVEFMSPSTYYRNRISAYQEFVKMLDS